MNHIKLFEEFELIAEEHPYGLGSVGHEAHMLYNLTNDDFSFIPKDYKTWLSFTDRTLMNKCVGFWNEEGYQREASKTNFFLIWYDNKMYLYRKIYGSEKGILYDSHDNKIKGKDNDVFTMQMNDIIGNTLHPRNR